MYRILIKSYPESNRSHSVDSTRTGHSLTWIALPLDLMTPRRGSRGPLSKLSSPSPRSPPRPLYGNWFVRPRGLFLVSEYLFPVFPAAETYEPPSSQGQTRCTAQGLAAIKLANTGHDVLFGPVQPARVSVFPPLGWEKRPAFPATPCWRALGFCAFRWVRLGLVFFSWRFLMLRRGWIICGGCFGDAARAQSLTVIFYYGLDFDFHVIDFGARKYFMCFFLFKLKNDR